MVSAVDISTNKDGGLLKEIIKEGVDSKLPGPGSNVKVHYTGTLLDGTKFDSSRDRNEPFIFCLGEGKVIKGWDIGIATMKKGENAILTCAPEYAYGEAGSPPTIPPNSTLKFDVEVLDWEDENLSPDARGKITRIQLVPGQGFISPKDGALVDIHITGKYQDKVFEDRDVSFHLGEGSDKEIIQGIEIALEKFKKGEKSQLIIDSFYAFGSKGSNKFEIPPEATVEYEITLKNFEKPKSLWSMDDEEKVEQAKIFKEKGTSYFSEKKFQLAIKMYKKVVEYLKAKEEDQTDIKDEIATTLLLSAHLNLSLCYLKLEEYTDAKNSAATALKMSPSNEKAIFRRGSALLELGEPILAQKDFQKCLELDPKNSSAKNLLLRCNDTLKRQLQKEKQIYANMFDKFAKRDTRKEEIEMKKEPNVMSSVGEWGAEDREREPSEFERENPNILLLNKTGEFKDM